MTILIFNDRRTRVHAPQELLEKQGLGASRPTEGARAAGGMGTGARRTGPLVKGNMGMIRLALGVRAS